MTIQLHTIMKVRNVLGNTFPSLDRKDIKPNPLTVKKVNWVFPFSTPRVRLILWFALILFIPNMLTAQIDNNGCVDANFGIDAGLYSGVIEFGDGTPAVGTTDWFAGPSGRGLINMTNSAAINALLLGGGNPRYVERMSSGFYSIVGGQILMAAVWARDRFGGTGYYDFSSFETASKNGENPAIWDIGQSNVLGKNDLLDVAGHMLRDGTTPTSDLWFMGLITRAEPGGSAYMDFEFFVKEVGVNAAPVPADPGEGQFDSGGPQMGHTAFQFNQTTGAIKSVGDFLFNVSLINGGIEPDIEMRLWVSYADYTTITPAAGFTWGPEFDGAYNGAPYGYASIVPIIKDACGIVNLNGQNPATPPWGALGGGTNSYISNFGDFAVLEVAVNMTAFGIDYASIAGADPCYFPIQTFLVKTRASAAFTAQLKDYAGPYRFGQPVVGTKIQGSPALSCLNPTVTLVADPVRTDVAYLWTTVNGNITSDPSLASITVDKPGTYTLSTTLPTLCTLPNVSVTVGYDPTKPFFNQPTATTKVACNGNDGSINLTVTGGTAPYSFLWSNGSTAEDPTGLAPGNYSVTITDAIGCTILSPNFTVGTRVPTIISHSATDVDCFGNKTGSINLTVSGQSPFTYLWSNGSTLQNRTGLAAGSYTVTTTDADGCSATHIATVGGPAAISATIASTTDVSTPLGSDGAIVLAVSGGTPGSGYTFDWDNDGTGDNDDSQNLSGLPAGTYTVIVTDANGCQTTVSATIYQPEICNDGIDNDNDGLTDCLDPDCGVTTPGPINPGSSPVCVGDLGVTYTIASTAADTYIWTVPAGATITAGQGSTQITVNWISNIGGQICVTATKNGCISAASCLPILLNDVPATPGTINVNN